MRDRTGQHVATYDLMRLLESGAFFDRYLALAPSSGQQVILLLSKPTDESGILRFQRNLPLFKRLAHPHIVSLLDAGVEGQTPFVVLDKLLTSRQAHSFPLPLQTIVCYVSQLAEALDYAHRQGVWHIYTTPETVLIGPRGEALLGGFIVRLLEISQMARNDLLEFPVPPVYLSPEQVLRTMPMDASIDQYALAVVVYVWLCGTPPFQGVTLLETITQQLHSPPPSLQGKTPAVPLKVEHVVMKALSRESSQRFSTVQEFASALAQANLDSTGA